VESLQRELENCEREMNVLRARIWELEGGVERTRDDVEAQHRRVCIALNDYRLGHRLTLYF
jgi:hypothetical protein